MPIYEYRCAQCGRTTEMFQRSLQGGSAPACEHCGHTKTTRALSRFATPNTEAQVLEQYGTPDPAAGPEAYQDPRQIGRWAEQRLKELGVDMPEDARKMIDAAREGNLPDPISDL